MPRVTVTAPDGTKYDVNAPAGATDDEILARVRGQWDADQKADRETVGAQQLGMGMAGTAGGTSPLGTLAAGALRGGSRALAGIGQAELEALNAIGINPLGVRAQDVPPAQAKVEAKLPEAPGIAGATGEFVGGMAPYALVPGGPEVQGVVAGATGLESGTPGESLVHRLTGGVLGGLGGAALHLLGAGAIKYANVQGIEDLLKKGMEEFGSLDPAKAPLRRSLNDTIGRVRGRYEELSKMALTEGDKAGALDVSGLQSKVGDLVTGAGRVSGQDAGAVKLLNDTQRVLTADTKMPTDLVVGGAKFTRNPLTGEYANAAGDTLNESIVKAATAGRSAGPPDIRYSQLRAMRDNLDQFLKTKEGSSNDAVKRVREMRAAIDAKVDEVGGPQAKALDRKAQQFYEKNLGKYDSPEIKDIIGAKDDLERANLILDRKDGLVYGNDVGLAKDVAGMLSKPGKEAVSKGLMKDALDAAMDPKTKKIDPVKFAHFFDDKPAAEPFKLDKFDDMVKGFSKYIKDDALKRGESTTLSVSRPVQHGLAASLFGLGTMHSIMSGDIMGAVKGMAAGASTEFAFSTLNRLMSDTWGRHLLVAASKVPEGSPRWGRLMAQINTRFGGPASGEAAQQTVSSPTAAPPGSIHQ